MNSNLPINRSPYHVSFVAADFDRALEWMTLAFGCRWTTRPGSVRASQRISRVEPPSTGRPRVAHSADGPIRFELTEVFSDAEAGDHIVALHHFGYWSDDVATDVAHMAADGWTHTGSGFGEDDRMVFAFVAHPEHGRIELVDAACFRESYLSQVTSI